MSSRILAGSVWLFLAGVVVAAAAFPVSSGDVWWHVAAGDYILASRSVPTRDVFSFSALGRPWVSHEWLFEVLLSLVFRLGGPAAAVIFKTALVLGTFALLGLALRRLKVDTLVAAPLLLLAASLLTFRAFVRPHVATELMLAVFLLVLFSDQGRGARRYFWLLVPVQLVWANLHAGAVLGPMVVLLFALGAGISRLVRRGRPEEPGDAGRHRTGLLFLLAGVLAAVTLANPSTWRPLLYPLFLSGSSTFTGSITELQSPLARAYWGADFFVCLVILAVGGAGSFVLARRLDPTRLLLFLVFGAAALLALRNVPLFAIVAVPVVALNVGSRLAVPAGPRLRAVLLAALTLLSAGLLWRTLTAGVRLPGGALRRPGLGVAAGAFPERAAGFVAANPIAGNVLNTMEFGGYLVWRWFPQRRVFVDGRLDVYGPAFFERYRRALWSGPQFDSIVREYDIGCALLACPPRLDGSTEHYLGRTLALRPDWSLVHWDDVALV
ncbi:hypothetical protein FJY71_01095, partial [candidate division WOR-3 bacterium]|nr:hypothetical protein [candidate division WOR-3 bacterium]